jgi:hypothetical protein
VKIVFILYQRCPCKTSYISPLGDHKGNGTGLEIEKRAIRKCGQKNNAIHRGGMMLIAVSVNDLWQPGMNLGKDEMIAAIDRLETPLLGRRPHRTRRSAA